MSNILGKVTGNRERPRGVDVLLRLQVERRWLLAGRTIEIELPRNLACARCSGGGCSVCGNSGAISLRERHEPPELVRVALPAQGAPNAIHAASQSVTLRIPDRGGLPNAAAGEEVRGLLLLTVTGSERADTAVRLAGSADSSVVLPLLETEQAALSDSAAYLTARVSSEPTAVPESGRRPSSPHRDSASGGTETSLPDQIASSPSREGDRSTWLLTTAGLVMLALAVGIGLWLF